MNCFSEILQGKNRYIVGLQQLDIAEEQVSVMQEQLETLEPKLKIAADLVAVKVGKVEADSEIVAVQREHVKKDEAAASEQAAVASGIHEECDAKLTEAMPILDAAISALNTLTPQGLFNKFLSNLFLKSYYLVVDITIVKTMKSPPIGIKVVMEAVCILKVVFSLMINQKLKIIIIFFA